MDIAEYTIRQIVLKDWIVSPSTKPTKTRNFSLKNIDLFRPLRDWLNNIEMNNPQQAHGICKLIPAQCPFARDINLFGRTIISIPPLCKLNPLYNELIALRFRALCYLSDECGEDIAQYC